MIEPRRLRVAAFGVGLLSSVLVAALALRADPPVARSHISAEPEALSSHSTPRAAALPAAPQPTAAAATTTATAANAARRPPKRERAKTRVHGVVLDRRGRPVAGARIRLVGFMDERLDETVTDADGRYEGFTEPGESVRVVAGADGFAPSELDGYGRDLTEDLEPIVLAPPAVVTGTVRDEQGRPVSGAEVRAWKKAPVIADDDGTFTLQNVSEGEAWFTVSASGFMPERLRAIAIGGETTSVIVTLRRGGRVQGTVRDESGEPVAKADVYVLGGQPRVRTGEDGSYEIDGLPPGPVDLWAIAYVGSKTAEKRVARVRGTVRVDEALVADLVLGVGTRIEGRLTDEAGVPMRAAVWIRLTDPAVRPNERMAWAETISAADGRFVIPNVVAGSYSVCVSHHLIKGGGETSPLLVRENVAVQGPVTTLDLASPQGCVIEGGAHDASGKPAFLASFFLFRDDGSNFPFVSTDGSGHFRIEGVPPGSYWLTLPNEDNTWEDSAEGCCRRRVVVPASGAVAPLDVELVAAAALAGRVTGPGEVPLANVKLHVRSSEGDDDFGVETDFHGRFQLRQGLIPGSYKLALEGDLALQARRLKLRQLVIEPVSFSVSPGQELELAVAAHE